MQPLLKKRKLVEDSTCVTLVCSLLDDLSHADRVSKQWRAALSDEALWRRQVIARAQRRSRDDDDVEPLVRWRGSWRATALASSDDCCEDSESETTTPDDAAAIVDDACQRRLARAGRPARLAAAFAPPPEMWTVAALAKRRPNRRLRCVAQGEPSDVTMLARDYAAYVRQNKDIEPLMVIDDRVPQDGACDAYPALAHIVKGDHLAELARRDDVEPAAAADLQRERKYVLWGGAGAGSRWHVDPYGTDAWNALLSGRKRWAFYPPGATPPGVDIVPRFVSASRTLWTTSPAAADWFSQAPPPGAQIVTQEAGDVVYIPAGWWHATLCETACVAITQNVIFAHNARAAHALMARSKPSLARELAALVRRRRADDGSDDGE